MRFLSLICFLILSFTLSFAQAKTDFDCDWYFAADFEAFKSALDTYDGAAMESIKKDIKEEHLRLVREHNTKVNEGTEEYYIYPMSDFYIGENIAYQLRDPNVHYFTDDQKKVHKIEIVNGQIFQQGELLSTVFKTDKIEMWDFVMTADGEIFIFDGNSIDIHHSSAVNGAPIAAAGMISVADGEVYTISTQTGHYTDPTARFILQFERELEKNGVDLSRIGRDYSLGNDLRYVISIANTNYLIPEEFFEDLLTFLNREAG